MNKYIYLLMLKDNDDVIKAFSSKKKIEKFIDDKSKEKELKNFKNCVKIFKMICY